MKLFLSLLLVISFFQTVFAADASQEEIERQGNIMRNLNWIEGPKTVNVGENATFSVPKDYVFLNPKDTETMMELMQNPRSSSSRYLFGPADLHWLALFSYENTGYIKDDEKIDADVVLQSIKEGTEQGNQNRVSKGWPEMKILGWKYKPFYDSQTQRLTWAIDAISENIPVINYNTRILGRQGVTSATLIAEPNNLQIDVVEFKNTLNNYQFNQDNQYSAFQEGDKIAEYGLMALVAGGAAAVATKKGLWAVIAGAFAVFWKLILAGFVVLLVGIGKIFGKKDS